VDVTAGTTTLPAGTYNLTATYTPPNTSEYNNATQTVSLDVSGESVWIVNSAGGASEFANTGYAISPYAGDENAVAIDHAGNVWSITTSASTMLETSQTGITQSSTGSGTGGLDGPAGIAIDGNSQVWTANSANNSVSLFSNSATALSPSGGFTDSSLSTPSGVAVDLGGSVWVTNKGNNSVTRILGAAAPAAPLSTAAKNNTTGAKP